MLKAELTLPPELVDLIADKVIEKLRPLLNGNGKASEPDIIFDVPGLAEYLQVSSKWIYERTQFKEIPYIKVKGLLRFRKKDIDKWLSSNSIPATSRQRGVLKAIK